MLTLAKTFSTSVDCFSDKQKSIGIELPSRLKTSHQIGANSEKSENSNSYSKDEISSRIHFHFLNGNILHEMMKKVFYSQILMHKLQCGNLCYEFDD